MRHPLLSVGLFIAIAIYLGSCQTPKGGAAGESAKSSATSDDEDDDSKGSGGGGGGDDLYVSNNYVTLAYSLSNNSLTSRTVQVSKAKDLSDDLSGKLANPTAKDRKDMIALMAAKRLSGEGIGAVFQVAKKLMVVEMREDIRREMPEVAQLELALASIHSRQFPMAEHWIEKLMDSKNDKTKAAALTAKGMIALIDGRLPEAVAFWNDALSVRKDYEPARLNIGFVALRYGDFRTAKAMLSGVGDDWFVQTGLMQAERLADNPKEAASLCTSILAKRKNYKPALFSCALNEYQGLGNFAKARTELEEVAKADGGPAIVDEKAYLTIGKIEKELREQQARERAAAAAKATQQQQQQGQGQNRPTPQQGQGAPHQNPPQQ